MARPETGAHKMPQHCVRRSVISTHAPDTEGEMAGKAAKAAKAARVRMPSTHVMACAHVGVLEALNFSHVRECIGRARPHASLDRLRLPTETL